MIFIINIQIVLQIVNTLKTLKIMPKYNYNRFVSKKLFRPSVFLNFLFVLALKYK